MRDFVPTKEDQTYWRGAMDALGLAVAEKIITKEQSEAARKEMAKIPHTHYSSILAAYCVVCHISLEGFAYDKWEDGQVNIA